MLQFKAKKLKFYLSKENTADHRVFKDSTSEQEIEVDATSLDEYFRNKSEKIDFIKIDIQGAEGAALKGMEFLDKNNPHLSFDFF